MFFGAEAERWVIGKDECPASVMSMHPFILLFRAETSRKLPLFGLSGYLLSYIFKLLFGKIVT